MVCSNSEHPSVARLLEGLEDELPYSLDPRFWVALRY
jgi:hypothetical protein